MSTVRSVIETLNWFILLSATKAVLLKGIFSSFINTHLPRLVGQGWADGRQMLRVPGGLDTKAFGSLVSDPLNCQLLFKKFLLKESILLVMKIRSILYIW